MRKITASLFISLDGIVEAPDQWHFPYFNEETGAALDATLGAADTVLFGRKTYDSFAGAWPIAEDHQLVKPGAQAGAAALGGVDRSLCPQGVGVAPTQRPSQGEAGDGGEAPLAPDL